MNKILEKIIENKEVENLRNNVIIAKFLTENGFGTVESYDKCKSEELLREANQLGLNITSSFEDIAKFIMNGENVQYAQDRLESYNSVCKDLIADLLVLNLDLAANEKFDDKHVDRIDALITTLFNQLLHFKLENEDDEDLIPSSPLDSYIRDFDRYLTNLSTYNPELASKFIQTVENIAAKEEAIVDEPVVEEPVVETEEQEDKVETDDEQENTLNKNITLEKYTKDIVQKLLNIVKLRDKVFEKEFRAITKINARSKNITQEQKDIITRYTTLFLNEKHLDVVYKNIITINEDDEVEIDFSNKTELAGLIGDIQTGIIAERSGFAVVVAKASEASFKNKLAKKLIGNKSTDYLSKGFDKIVKENIATGIVSDELNSILDEIYKLTDDLVQPFIKAETTPYSLVSPRELKIILSKDRSKIDPQFPNLYDILKISQSLENSMVKTVLESEIQQTKGLINAVKQKNNLNDETVNIKYMNLLLANAQHLVEELESPIATRKNKEKIVEELKVIYAELKTMKKEGLIEKVGEKQVKDMGQLISLAGTIKTKTPKDTIKDLLKLSISDETLAAEVVGEFEQDIDKLTKENREDVYYKYAYRVGKENESEFKEAFDSLTTYSTNSVNKKVILADLETSTAEYLNSKTITQEQASRENFLLERSKILLNSVLTISKDDQKDIATKELKETISELLKHNPAKQAEVLAKLDRAIVDVANAQVEIKNNFLKQNVTSILKRLNLDSEKFEELQNLLSNITTEQHISDFLQICENTDGINDKACLQIQDIMMKLEMAIESENEDLD